MIKRIFGSKLFVLFLSLIIIGFFIGYDYTLIAARNENRHILKVSGNDEGQKYNQIPTSNGDSGKITETK